MHSCSLVRSRLWDWVHSWTMDWIILMGRVDWEVGGGCFCCKEYLRLVSDDFLAIWSSSCPSESQILSSWVLTSFQWLGSSRTSGSWTSQKIAKTVSIFSRLRSKPWQKVESLMIAETWKLRFSHGTSAWSILPIQNFMVSVHCSSARTSSALACPTSSLSSFKVGWVSRAINRFSSQHRHTSTPLSQWSSLPTLAINTSSVVWWSPSTVPARLLVSVC